MAEARYLAVALALAGWGCGGGGGGGDCAPFDGVYRVVIDERSGTCGDAEFIERYDPNETEDESSARNGLECERHSKVTEDGCHEEVDRKCEVRDDVTGELIGYSHIIGTVSGNTSGTRAHGDIDISVYDPSGNDVCHSVATISYTKL